MADRTIDIALKMSPDKSGAAAKDVKKLEQALKDVEAQANRTREKMEKLAQVGSKLAMTGAAIVAPFALAMNKYATLANEAVKSGGKLEPTAQRLAELSERWEASQARLGKVTAEIVLPALEKGMAILDDVITFAEANPGVVRAALTIGSTMIILGGIIATTAQLVSTVATIQGLAAAAGLASVGGGAAAGAAGAAGTAAAGGAAVVTAGVTAAIPALVGAFALWIGGNIGKFIGEALTGQATSWADIALTAKRILILDAELVDQVLGWMGMSTDFSGALARAFGTSDSILTRQMNSETTAQIQATNNAAVVQANATMSLGQSFANGWASLVAAIRSLFMGGRATGGYVENGIYRMGERGSEFVLNAQTTKAAEGLIGGRLTQGRALGMMTNNFQIRNGATIRQTKRMIAENNQGIFNALAGAL